MNKNILDEIELSEEQLQDITGGCAQCDGIRKQITTAQTALNESARQYNLAVAERRQADALTHYSNNMRLIDVVAGHQSTLERTTARLHPPVL